MLIRRGDDVPAPEITAESLYFRRREFIAAGGGAVLAAMVPSRLLPRRQDPDEPTPHDAVTTYNNYYEFGTGKDDPSRLARAFNPRPWSIEIAGEVKRPATYDLDVLLRPHASQERVYRHRCVEGWSMVVPWLGFPLRDLVKRVEPTTGRSMSSLRPCSLRTGCRDSTARSCPGRTWKHSGWTKHFIRSPCS